MRKDEIKPFYKSHWFRWLCTVYVSFLVGAVVTTILTNVGKYTVGRLRPHFLAVCKPDFSKLNCTTGFQKNFITNYECTGDEHQINEARLSFPSGHSSHAGYCMTFLVLYVDLQMTYCASLKLFKIMVEFVLVLLAVLCGLSRVADYKHHLSDVFAGFVIGILVAFYFVLRDLELHRVNPTVNEPQVIDKNIQELDDIEGGGTP